MRRRPPISTSTNTLFPYTTLFRSRVITGGVLAPLASSMFECQQKIIAEQDWLRGMLLSDPRGSVNAAVNLITPPVAPDADLGMIVIESDHYPPDRKSVV